MTDEDTRSLPAAAQAALRTRAVRAVLGGMTQAHAARVFGAPPNAVNPWIRRYREGGFPGLSARRRGTPSGRAGNAHRNPAAGGDRAGPGGHSRSARTAGVS